MVLLSTKQEVFSMPRKQAAEPPPDDSRRERILHAAFDAFMAHGYAGASTLEIATRAKLSKRELYLEFGSKQAILAACLEGKAQRLRQPLELPPARDRAMLAAVLTTYGDTLLRELSQPVVTAMFRLAVTEAERSPEIARALDAVRQSTRAALAKLLQQAQSSGLIGPGDAEDMVTNFAGLLWGNTQIRLLLGVSEPPSPEESKRRAVNATSSLLKLYPVEK
jgi:AcrR family transcriptional regulator